MITINYHSIVSGQPKKLSEALRDWRDQHGWKQWKAAEILGCKLATYRNWERGRNEPQGLARDAVITKIQAS